MRVAVVFAGDARDPGAWSGTPAGVVAGLEASGAEVVAVRAALPAAVEHRLLQGLGAPRLLPGRRTSWERGWRHALGEAEGHARLGLAHARMSTLAAAGGLRRAGPVDAVVQVGTSYRVRHSRTVTYEDMTIPQVLGRPYFGWEGLSAREVRARIALQRQAYAAARACTAATPWAARSMVDDLGVEPARAVPVGIGRNHDPAPAERDWSTPRYLFVGKDWEDKNGPALLRAFARVRADHPDAVLDLVGHHPRVDRPGVTGHGFLRRDDPAAVRTMRGLFDRATCLVVPTTFEPAGIVYVEAAAAGLPVVGTSEGGARDLIGSGGLVADPLDDAAIATAMARLADPATARRTGRAALRRAALLTWPGVGRRLLQTAGVLDRDDGDWDGLFAADLS